MTNIPAPRVPFIDDRTGLISREWYRFLLNLFTLTGSGENSVSINELMIGPTPLLIDPMQLERDAASIAALELAPAVQQDDPMRLLRVESALEGVQQLPQDQPPLPPPDNIEVSRVYPTFSDIDSAVLAAMSRYESQLAVIMDMINSLQAGPMLLPPYGQQQAGGIRKGNNDQTIGNLAGNYVPIVGYTSNTFALLQGVSTDLANGTITLSNAGNYNLTVNLGLTFNSDNNSTRVIGLRIYDVTAGSVVTDADTTVFVGAYVGGIDDSFSIPVSFVSSRLNHALRVEIGAGSNFLNVMVTSAAFSVTSVGPV